MRRTTRLPRRMRGTTRSPYIRGPRTATSRLRGRSPETPRDSLPRPGSPYRIRTRLLSQVRGLDPRFLAQLLRGAGEGDPARLEDIGVAGDLERLLHALLDEQDGGPSRVDLADDREDVRRHERSEA